MALASLTRFISSLVLTTCRIIGGTVMDASDSSSNGEIGDENSLIFPLTLNMGLNEERRFGDV